MADKTATVTILVKGEDKTGSAFGSVLDNFQKIGKFAAVAGVAVVGAAVAAAAKSTMAFVGYQNSLNEVFTLLPGISQGAMNDMSAQVLQFSKDFAVLPEKVIPALYQALSAGVPPDNVFAFMEVAQMAAIGGVTELEIAVDGITSVVNAYGESVIGAGRASDVMFTAVRLGKTDFEQLSRSLFNVIPTAASLGVSFEDIASQLAILTASGTPTSVATTQIRAALVDASRGGSKLSDAIAELTGKSFTDLIASGATSVEIFQQLRESMPEQDFKDLFSSVEATNAVLGVTGPNFERTTAAMLEMSNAAGATEAAYDTMDQGLARNIDRFKTFANVTMIQVGEALSPMLGMLMELAEGAMPAIENAINTVIPILNTIVRLFRIFFIDIKEGYSFVDALSNLVEEMAVKAFGLTSEEAMKLSAQVRGIIETVKELTASVLAILEPILTWAKNTVQMKDVLLVLVGVILIAVLPALWTLLATIISIVAPIIAVIAIVAALRTAWERDFLGIRTALTAFWENTGRPIFLLVQQWIGTHVPAAIATLTDFFNNKLMPVVRTVWNYFQNSLIPLWKAVANLIEVVLTLAFTVLRNYIDANVMPVLRELYRLFEAHVLPVLRDLWDIIARLLQPVIDSMSGAFNRWGSAIGGITGAIRDAIGWINNLADALAGISLPSGLAPGSPSPFETSLRGITSAIRELNASPMNLLRRNLNDLNGTGTSPGVGIAGATGPTINNNYYLTANYAHQNEQSIASDIRAMQLLRG